MKYQGAMTGMLNVVNVGYRRNLQVIFRNITFKLEPGSWMEISGPNGSGKTTLLKILAGLILPTRGKIVWESPALIHYLPQTPSLYEGLTAEENLKYYDLLYGNQNKPESIPKPDLQHDSHRNKLCSTLSAGEKQKLSLSKLKTTPATLWLLDEPLNALDKQAIADFTEIFDAHIDRGGMAVLASHMSFSCRQPKIAQLILNRDLESDYVDRK